jgi:hypothetical protein
MKITDWQQICFPCLQPSFLFQTLTLGAMPVPTRIVGNIQGPTGIAFTNMSTQLFGAANLYGTHDAQVPYRQFVGLAIRNPVLPKDIGNL